MIYPAEMEAFVNPVLSDAGQALDDLSTMTMIDKQVVIIKGRFLIESRNRIFLVSV